MSTRRFGKPWKIAAGVAAVVVLGLIFYPYGDSEATPAAEEQYETATASITTVEEIVTGSFTIEDRTSKEITTIIHTAGIVTEIVVEKDDTPEPLQHLMDIDGEPVFALVGGTPFYRQITARTSKGDDIRTLEDNLVAAGYDVGDVDGEADNDLRRAIQKWQKDEDRKETGVFDPSSFVWFPEGYSVDDVLIDIGTMVHLETPIARVGKPGRLVAVALIGQEDVTELKDGLSAVLELDGLPDIDLTGSVIEVEDQPATGTSDFPVEIGIDDLPTEVWDGMKGEAEILVARHRDVVVVPTGAVSGPVDSPTVRVLIDGRVENRSITVGLVTPADTVVVSGVAVGEQIIVADKEA